MLILNSGYRQVTMRINKQEQSTPLTDVNLLNCLLSCANILPVFELRETRAESSSYIKSTNGNATHNSLISNKNCLSRFPYREGGTWCHHDTP